MKSDTCVIDECEKRVRARGWCSKHYESWYRYGDPLTAKTQVRHPDGTIDKQSGYRRKKIDGRVVLMHRHIMEQVLERKLFSDESVHHKNGVRSDNRCENLELRVGAHPQGLTVDEALGWAREIIGRYEL